MKAVGSYSGSIGRIHWSVVISGKTDPNFAGDFIITVNGRNRGGAYDNIGDILPTFAKAIQEAQAAQDRKGADAPEGGAK